MTAEGPPGLACLCGYENFERVVVERVANRPIVTDFVACVGCRAMYFSPLKKPKPPTAAAPTEPPRKPTPMPAPKQEEYAFPTLRSNVPAGWIEPATDSLERLKADATEAAKAYRKPGRARRLGTCGRR